MPPITSISHIDSTTRRDLYQVQFYHHTIQTAVTSNSHYVKTWLSKIHRIHRRRLRSGGLIVGLDVEWRPNFRPNSARNPVALLQLCVGHHCLVFQIFHAHEISQFLAWFLDNQNYTFVGVGIKDDVQRIYDDYDLNVANTVDLRSLAASRYGDRGLQNMSLTRLATMVLGADYDKPRKITMSDWAVEELSPDQIQYACIDAFLSFEIGKTLSAACEY